MESKYLNNKVNGIFKNNNKQLYIQKNIINKKIKIFINILLL